MMAKATPERQMELRQAEMKRAIQAMTLAGAKIRDLLHEHPDKQFPMKLSFTNAVRTAAAVLDELRDKLP